jgi:hypothetical protein
VGGDLVKRFLQEEGEMGFQLHVLSTLHRMEGRQEYVISTLHSHSQILRQHARRITQSEGKHARNKKDGGIWYDMALQLWSKVILVIIATALLGLGSLMNLSPERAAQLFQGVFGK